MTLASVVAAMAVINGDDAHSDERLAVTVRVREIRWNNHHHHHHHHHLGNVDVDERL